MRVSLEFAYWQSVLGGLAKPRISVTLTFRIVVKLRQEGWGVSRPGMEFKISLRILSRGFTSRPIVASNLAWNADSLRWPCLPILTQSWASILSVGTNTTQEAGVFEETLCQLSPYANIKLVRSDYREFIRGEHGSFGLIHVD